MTPAVAWLLRPKRWPRQGFKGLEKQAVLADAECPGAARAGLGLLSTANWRPWPGANLTPADPRSAPSNVTARRKPQERGSGRSPTGFQPWLRRNDHLARTEFDHRKYAASTDTRNPGPEEGAGTDHAIIAGHGVTVMESAERPLPRCQLRH